MSKKILLIQFKQLGDVLMITPALRALNKAGFEVHVLTQPPANQIFACSPYVERVFLFPKQKMEAFQLVWSLRKQGYDGVIDFQGSPKTALAAWLSGAKLKVGFDFRGRRLFYDQAIGAVEAQDYSPLKKNLLLGPFGATPDGHKLDFFIGLKDKSYAVDLFERLKVDPNRPLISVSPVSRRDYKVWDLSNHAKLCDHLVQRYHAQILFLWGPGEHHFVKAVRQSMTSTDLGDYEVPSLSETVALLQRVDLHLGNDNGVMHMAIAAGKPSLAIFGRPQLKHWTPPNSKRHLAIEHDPGCKGECYFPKCELECLKVEPQAVIRLLDQQMAKLLKPS